MTAASSTARAPASAPDLARREVTIIQIGRRALGLDDDTYHGMIACLCDGKTSSTDLTAQERKRVIDHLKAAGFVLKPKSKAPDDGLIREPQMRKLRAMWWQLADAGHVERPASVKACQAAVEAWAKRQLSGGAHPLTALRWATAAQMDVLVESMKRWCRRVGVAVVG